MWFTQVHNRRNEKVRSGNPNFLYEISCDQMWERPLLHEGIIVVESEADYKNGWMHSKSPNT